MTLGDIFKEDLKNLQSGAMLVIENVKMSQGLEVLGA